MKLLKQAFDYLFKTDTAISVANNLYWQIVTLSRTPALYEKFKIPDTLDGRFDSLMLHLFMVIERLKVLNEHKIANHLLDFFIKDMDRSLRETGVGDPSISRKMRKIGEAYLGRMNAYGLAFDTKTDIQSVLHKNIYRLADIAPSYITLLSNYVLHYRALLNNFMPKQKLPEYTFDLINTYESL
jgi:cytochrome b pre-mRNA-processing protein 3